MAKSKAGEEFFPNTELADATPTWACQGPDGLLYTETLAVARQLVTV